MNMKAILIFVGALVLVVGYVFISDSGESASNSITANTPNKFDRITKQASIPEMSDVKKTDLYLKEQNEIEKMEEEYENAIEHKDPRNLTASTSEAYKTSIEKKMEGIRQQDLTPRYGNKSYSASDDVTTENKLDNSNNTLTVTKSTKKVYTANVGPSSKTTVPTNRKSEVQKDNASSTLSSNADVFNMTAFNKSTATATSSSTSKQDNLQQNSTESYNNVSSSMVKASVLGPHTVKTGGLIRFRLLEPATFKGITFPRNTIFHGKATFGQDRLLVTVDRLPYGKGFADVPLTLHDQDLQAGIYAPVRETKEAATDETLDGVGDILSSSGSVAGQLGNGVARVFRTATNGTQKVSVADGYPVLFLFEE